MNRRLIKPNRTVMLQDKPSEANLFGFKKLIIELELFLTALHSVYCYCVYLNFFFFFLQFLSHHFRRTDGNLVHLNFKQIQIHKTLQVFCCCYEKIISNSGSLMPRYHYFPHTNSPWSVLHLVRQRNLPTITICIN